MCTIWLTNIIREILSLQEIVDKNLESNIVVAVFFVWNWLVASVSYIVSLSSCLMLTNYYSFFFLLFSCLNWLDISITMSSSMSEVPNPHIKTCEKCCNDKILRTSCTRENLNCKFWKCKRCGVFEWDDDRKNNEYIVCLEVDDRNMSEIKIDLLLGEVLEKGQNN